VLEEKNTEKKIEKQYSKKIKQVEIFTFSIHMQNKFLLALAEKRLKKNDICILFRF
jgi:hypothetical protein